MPFDSQRADKYLHCVRLFATRSLAVAACDKSNVLIAGQAIKPARGLRIGEVLHVERGDLRMVIQVTAFPASRVGAALVADFYADLTPPENYARAAKIREQQRLTASLSNAALVKPTKKDGRLIRRWLEQE